MSEIMDRSSYSKAVTIRIENIGIIIWSPIKHRYFLLSHEYRDDFTNLILNGSSISRVLDSLPEIKNDLMGIGVNDNAQIINNLNRCNRPLYAPLEYYFDYTSKCNLKCKVCYNIDTWGNTCMSPDTVNSIIKEMLNLGIRRTYLAGGEPLTNIEVLHAYFDSCYKYGITASLATNGTLLTEDICEYLLSKELFDISVSLDGWNSESSIMYRGREHFDEAIIGVQNLVKTKNKMKSKTEICIKPIIDRQLDEYYYEKMVELAIELKVDKLKLINPERSINHPRGYYGKDVQKYYLMNSLISNLQNKYKNTIVITNGSNPCNGFGNIGIKGMNGCVGGQELLAINPDGRISPCLMDHTQLGNYYDFGSMKSFLDNCTKLESYQLKKDYKKCHDCEIYSRCRGGCQVRKIVQTGTREGIDPICPIHNAVLINKNISKYSENLDLIICAHSL